MAYTTIDDPSAYFQTTLYTGNASTQSITNTGNSNLQPDWVWVKQRTGTQSHVLFDAVRGAGKALVTNTTAAEDTQANAVSAFNTDGFSLGDGSSANSNSETYVAWQWKAGTSVSGTTSGSGTGKAYSGSVSTAAGFSIIKYLGNGTSGHTIPHHLTTAPKVIIVKNLENGSYEWIIGHKDLASGATGFSANWYFNGFATGARNQNATASWNSTSPTTSVFSLHSGATYMNANDEANIAYCFAEKQGYSKFGSFLGSSNQQFIYLGFKPKFFLWKNTSQGNSTYDHWGMVDTARQPYNGNTDGYLRANQNSGESSFSGNGLFFLGNGIQFNNTGRYNNNSGDTYIYLAFAENPFVTSTGVPATAR